MRVQRVGRLVDSAGRQGAARPVRRRPGTSAGIAALLLAACTSSVGDPLPEPEPSIPVAATHTPAGPQVLDGRDAPTLAVQAARSVWSASPVVVTAPDGNPKALARAAAEASDLAVPLFVIPSGSDAPPDSSASPAPGTAAPDPAAAVADEMARLGVTHALHVGPDAPTFAGIEVLTARAALPNFRGAAPVPDLVVLTAPDAAPRRADDAAVGSLVAAGARVLKLADVDPRVSARDVAAVAGVTASAVVGVGRGFGPDSTFTQRVEAAATGVQLPGGGQTIFDGTRYVALYGHPRTGALGVLGEQGPARTIARARRVAARYEPHAREAIVPALEIIATVATGSAGEDRDFSNEWDVEALRPLVDRAAASGLYVVLDLQPGRDDFLSQAKLYEELLTEPHVGLAMDPEWRLGPRQKPLRQVGSVSAAEINRALEWLAQLTDAHDLPQKMVLLHQFRTDMIRNRSDLDLHHDELAVVVQMDGDGTLEQKLATWNALRADAPEGLRFGWKNFYDEDEPTPSEKTTFQVRPKPWWVSYQ